jgi:predicted O-methyltransferase YrrM
LTGQIGFNESLLLLKAIARRKPEQFVEIGTASGFSTKLISTVMKRYCNGDLVTFDISDRWYLDPLKPVGFMARGAAENRVKVRFVQGTSVAIYDIFGAPTIDAAFVDGSHYHPWPTIDTLLLLPLMQPNGFIIHHDLNLYMTYEYRDQIGPKFLYDQIPDHMKERDGCEPFSRSYCVFPPENYLTLTENMIQSLRLPWAGGAHEEIKSDPKLIDIIAANWGLPIADCLREMSQVP